MVKPLKSSLNAKKAPSLGHPTAAVLCPEEVILSPSCWTVSRQIGCFSQGTAPGKDENHMKIRTQIHWLSSESEQDLDHRDSVFQVLVTCPVVHVRSPTFQALNLPDVSATVHSGANRFRYATES